MKLEYIKNYIKNKYNNSSDLVTRELNINSKKILYIYLESVSSDDKISDFFMKQIKNYKTFNNLFNSLKNNIPNSHLIIENNIDDVFYKLASGYTCIFIENNKKFISIETKSTLDRGINESTTETILRGPKDSFTENIVTNIGLIRKRIKDYNLCFDETIIGRRSKSKVIISYINDIANKKNIEIIKNKIESIDIDGILDSGYIRDFLSDNDSFFPKIKSTERPDLVSMSLLDGKIIILVENSPYALILPSVLNDFIISPEDYYEKSGNANFNKIIRIISFILTIIIPGFYVAITTFNQEIIPDELLISITTQREGVPIPTILEVFMMITTFEILRESDIRLPSKMSSAISIVGALVLGDAAVSAGIVSPIVIIVVAITSICGLLFTDIDFINAIRWWRFLFLFLGGTLGIVGIMISSILFINKLCSMKILDVNYLTPISPLITKDIKNTLFKNDINKIKNRPSYLTSNTKKVGDS